MTTATLEKPKSKKSTKPAKATKVVVKTPKVKEEKGPVAILTGDSLTSGSTRSRLFRCLKKFPGSSASKIKDKTGMLPNSGHLAVLLGEELEAKRIRSAVPAEDSDDRGIAYFLTAKGEDDLKNKMVDKRGNAGGRIGKKWTPARKKADK